MRLPKFTAEASLYRTSDCYQGASISSSSGTGVYPAQSVGILDSIDSIPREISKVPFRDPLDCRKITIPIYETKCDFIRGYYVCFSVKVGEYNRTICKRNY
jgi:hypothetical protein